MRSWLSISDKKVPKQVISENRQQAYFFTCFHYFFNMFHRLIKYWHYNLSEMNLLSNGYHFLLVYKKNSPCNFGNLKKIKKNNSPKFLKYYKDFTKSSWNLKNKYLLKRTNHWSTGSAHDSPEGAETSGVGLAPEGWKRADGCLELKTKNRGFCHW